MIHLNEMKNQLESLDEKDLKLVESFIKSLNSRKKPAHPTQDPTPRYYEKVIMLMKNNSFSSNDIECGRTDRV